MNEEIITEYLFKDSSSKIYNSLANVLYLVIAYQFGFQTAAIGFIIIEILNFVVWYTQIRTGKLDEKAEKAFELGGK